MLPSLWQPRQLLPLLQDRRPGAEGGGHQCCRHGDLAGRLGLKAGRRTARAPPPVPATSVWRARQSRPGGLLSGRMTRGCSPSLTRTTRDDEDENIVKNFVVGTSQQPPRSFTWPQMAPEVASTSGALVAQIAASACFRLRMCRYRISAGGVFWRC